MLYVDCIRPAFFEIKETSPSKGSAVFKPQAMPPFSSFKVQMKADVAFMISENSPELLNNY